MIETVPDVQADPAAEDVAEGTLTVISESADWTGVSSPSRRGSSQRFLTDVIIVGLVSRRQVEEAIETSRATGAVPERVLLPPPAAGSARHPRRRPPVASCPAPRA